MQEDRLKILQERSVVKLFVDPKDFYPEVTDQGVKDLYKLAEIVMNCHFTYVSYNDREDLTSVAILKAISFIKESEFDPTRSSLKNVLYTAMRNEMKNTLYRMSKDTPVDDEILIGANESTASVEDNDSYIEINDINIPRCREIDKVKSSLAYLGFIVNTPEKKYYEEVDRWIALAIHQKIR